MKKAPGFLLISLLALCLTACGSVDPSPDADIDLPPAQGSSQSEKEPATSLEAAPPVSESGGTSAGESNLCIQENTDRVLILTMFSYDRFNDGAKIAVKLLRRLLPATSDPPQHHFHKAAGDVVDQKVLRNVGIRFSVLVDELGTYQLIQAVLEKAQEDFAALAGKQRNDILVVFL